eukprot:1097076-Prymnesium_polylepis.1
MRRRGRSAQSDTLPVHDTPPRRRARRHARSLALAIVVDDRRHRPPRRCRPCLARAAAALRAAPPAV